MSNAQIAELERELKEKTHRLVTDFDSPMDGWAAAYATRIAEIMVMVSDEMERRRESKA